MKYIEMKKLITLAIVLSAPASFATLFVEEGMDGNLGSEFIGSAGGSGFSTAWTTTSTVQAGDFVFGAGLSYTDVSGNSLLTSGNAFLNQSQHLKSPANMGMRRGLASPITSGEFYFSFLYKEITAGHDYVFQMYPATGTTGDALIARGSWSSTESWRFNSTVMAGMLLPQAGETQFMVARVNMDTKTISVWQNPDLAAPGAPGFTGATLNSNFSNLQLFVKNETVESYSWDEIRIGSTFADVAPIFIPSVQVPTLRVAINGPNLDFSWDSTDGMLYDLVSSPDLSTPVSTWPVVASNEAMVADPGGTNTLSVVRPVLEKHFYALAVHLAPTVVLFSSDFETDDGGMTFVDNSGGAGTPWAWGAPDSDNAAGSVVTKGTDGSAKCWATGLGSFAANGDNGFYNASTNASLRTPVIDLTTLTSATLSFSQAMDVSGIDLTVVNFLDADNGDAILASQVYIDGDINTAMWESERLSVPAAALGKNVRIEWSLSTTSTTNYIGWYIDDVKVTDD